MELNEIRKAIQDEMRNGIDSPRLTELLVKRDELLASQPKVEPVYSYEDMLDLLHN